MNYTDPLIFLSKSSVLLLSIYMLVFSNILLELFGCRMQHFLKNNMLAKHFIGLFLFFIFNVLTDNDISNKPIVYVTSMTILTYFWFVLTTRMPFRISIIVIMLLISIFTLDIYTQRYEKTSLDEAEIKKQYIETINNVRSFIVILTFVLTCIGVVIYFREKQLEYKTKFDILTFFKGNPQCKNYTPRNAKVFSTV
jgi:hypothetical protein